MLPSLRSFCTPKAPPKKLNSDEHFDRAFSFVAVEANSETKKRRKKEKYESPDSVQKITNAVSLYCSGACRARVSPARTRGRRDRLEPDCVERDRRDCGSAAAGVGAALCDGAGGGL